MEDANIKLTTVVSNVLGKSGRAILHALIDGEVDPERLADLTRGRLKATRAQVVAALRGHIRDHHRFLLKLHLGQIDALEQAITDLEARVDKQLDPFRAQVDLLTTMPGVSDTFARVLVSEVGTDMTRFPTAAHMVSWAGMCPRSDESAGKRRSARIRKGAPWLKTALVQCAWAAIRTKDSYLRAQFYRLKSRVGPMKAIVAVGASMLTAAYHMLRNAQPYRELGAAHLDQRDSTKLTKRLVRRLEDLGLTVTVAKVA